MSCVETDLRVRELRTWRSAEQPNALWVEVVTDSGHTGLGETWYGPEAVEAVIHTVGARYLLGRDPGLITTHQQALLTLWSRKGSGAESRAASAIDTALWDLMGRVRDLPLHRMVGGAVRDSVPAYVTCVGPGYQRRPLAVGDALYGPTVPGGRHEDLWATRHAPGDLARELVDEGYPTMKVLPFDATLAYGAGDLVRAGDLREGLAALAAMRDAVGDGIEIAVECRGRWNVPSAVRLAHALAPFSPCWLEDPVRNESADALARVRRCTGIPVAAGESLGSSFRHVELVRADAVDVLLTDVSWNGGVTEALKVVDLAAAHLLPAGLHDCTGPVGLAASLHLALARPAVFAQEVVRGYHQGWYREAVRGLPDLRDGRLWRDDAPGHGVTLHPDFLARPTTTRRSST